MFQPPRIYVTLAATGSYGKLLPQPLAANESYLPGGRQKPQKAIYLAVVSCHGKLFTWQHSTTKEI
jgi:hypothetical protein